MESEQSIIWDSRFLQLCSHVASWSKDPSTKVGACVVDSRKRVVSLGYNGFPTGVLDYTDRLNVRETKLLFVCHAERNALDNAPHKVEGCTLYCTLMPCNECAKSIIQNGIKRVCTYKPIATDKYNWDITKIMFYEAGVILDYHNNMEINYA